MGSGHLGAAPVTRIVGGVDVVVEFFHTEFEIFEVWRKTVLPGMFSSFIIRGEIVDKRNCTNYKVLVKVKKKDTVPVAFCMSFTGKFIYPVPVLV